MENISMKIFEMDGIAEQQSKERTLDDFLFYAGDVFLKKFIISEFLIL